MEIKELRKGNYVGYNVETVVYKGETSEGVSVENLKGTFTAKVHSNYITPIPINDKWLEDLGFEINNGAYCILIDPLQRLHFEDGKVSIDYELEDYTLRTTLPHINSIHSLQNLYHSLTGKELTLEKEESEPERIQREAGEMGKDAITAEQFCKMMSDAFKDFADRISEKD